ncbi:DNA-binding protein [Streptomyces sp. HUAS TT7]|uniref:DNA-binding protein n=1 Tax=Streptomyces sp. HUAS TT7 TaxID=3447507 RepID=UPI003F65769F
MIIPHGHPAISEAEIAEEAGTPLHTWRRRHGADFRARVEVINPGERLKLYDQAQARAFLAGKPLPARPDTFEPHPDDLLSDRAAADVLGVDPSTVRAYAKTGYIEEGEEHHGRRWWRRGPLLERREAGDQRRHPERTGAGRAPGSTGAPARRAREVAADLAAGQEPTAAELAERYQVTRTTGARILADARALRQGQNA